MQACILDFLRDPPARRPQRRVKFVDLFCGIGGASTGAASAGYDVVLAVDSWDVALKAHAANHPGATHLCARLPPQQPLPVPPATEEWHLHGERPRRAPRPPRTAHRATAPTHRAGSPPCTKLSNANQERDPSEREDAMQLVRWFIDFALTSGASTWSMEQVATSAVVSCVEQYKRPNSPHRMRVDFDIFDFYHLGVPQHRRRLIAGSPKLLARLRRAPRVHRCVDDVIAAPRGTHIRNYVAYNHTTRPKVLNGKKVYKYIARGPDEYCNPTSGPSHVILAGIPLRWATPGTGGKFKLLSPEESAAIQCFPPHYVLPDTKTLATRAVGNALPPLVMQLMLASAPPRTLLPKYAPNVLNQGNHPL